MSPVSVGPAGSALAQSLVKQEAWAVVLAGSSHVSVFSHLFQSL